MPKKHLAKQDSRGRSSNRIPSGRASLPVKIADTKDAVNAGADEIDMVIDRGAFLSGNYLEVYKQILAVKAACVRNDRNPRPPKGDSGNRRTRDLRQHKARQLSCNACRPRLY